MVSITQVFQYYVSKQSEEIHRLKNQNLVRETFENIAYVSPDGKSFVNRNSRRATAVSAWKLAKVSYEKRTGYMSQKHPDWKLYISAKRRASVLLTARIILKLNDEHIPEFKALQRNIRDGGLCHHARRGKERYICIQAYRYLKKIDNRLKNRSEKLAHIESSLASRKTLKEEENG
ncbi:MAG TPA: hypothetical protein VFC63_23250 [Blastocatellia bacterium]|nr:hypothetical protein [Blastocatellia bacterium]